MTLLKLASYLKGQVTASIFNECEVAGFLYGLKFVKKITRKDFELIYCYIFPESKPYPGEMKEELLKIKRQIFKKIL